MKRLLVISLMLTALVFSARAQEESPVHVGADWGFMATMLNFHHYNYMDEGIGYRIDDRGWSSDMGANAYAFLCASLDLGNRFNLGVIGGYAGVNDGVRVIPVELRLIYFPRSSHEDGMLVFLQGGAGFKTGEGDGIIFLGQGGAGYRLALSRRHSLDFKLCLQVSYDHPKVWDPLEQNYISERNIRRDNASYYGLGLGLGLEF